MKMSLPELLHKVADCVDAEATRAFDMPDDMVIDSVQAMQDPKTQAITISMRLMRCKDVFIGWREVESTEPFEFVKSTPSAARRGYIIRCSLELYENSGGANALLDSFRGMVGTAETGEVILIPQDVELTDSKVDGAFLLLKLSHPSFPVVPEGAPYPTLTLLSVGPSGKDWPMWRTVLHPVSQTKCPGDGDDCDPPTASCVFGHGKFIFNKATGSDEQCDTPTVVGGE